MRFLLHPHTLWSRSTVSFALALEHSQYLHILNLVQKEHTCSGAPGTEYGQALVGWSLRSAGKSRT